MSKDDDAAADDNDDGNDDVNDDNEEVENRWKKSLRLQSKKLCNE